MQFFGQCGFTTHSSRWMRLKIHAYSLEVSDNKSTASFNDKISHWIGKIASKPYTNLKGVNLVAFLTEVQYSDKAEYRIK